MKWIHSNKQLKYYKKLSQAELLELFNQFMDKNDKNAERDLYFSQIPLIIKLVDKFAAAYKTRHNKDDLFQEACYHLLQNIEKYPPQKFTFHKWASIVISRRLNRLCNPKYRKLETTFQKNLFSIEELRNPIGSISNYNSDSWERKITTQEDNSVTAKEILKTLKEYLTIEEYTILSKYGEVGNISDTATQLGLKRSSTYTKYSKAIAIIQKNLKNFYNDNE